MAIKIGSNIASIQAQRRLGEATSSLSKIYGRLSSGLRINTASDDAAGLSVASKLQADSQVYTMAVKNVNDGISYLSIAEGAVSSLKNITVRMRELSTQASNGVYGDSQRTALNNEYQLLTQEYNRILETTSFNGTKIFLSQNDTVSIQAGYGSSSTLSFSLLTTQASQLNSISIISTAADGSLENSSGQYAFGAIGGSAMSANGRYTVFYSAATNLVPGVTDGNLHVFYKDRVTGAISVVDSDQNGLLANNTSSNASVSSNGRYVVFASSASNLVSGDTNLLSDVFVKDMQTGQVSRANITAAGVQDGSGGANARVSDDGRYVYFQSNTVVFGLGGGGGFSEIYRKDLLTGALALASSDNAGVVGNGTSTFASTSADGRYVAFTSTSTNLVAGASTGVYLKDMQTGQISLISSTAAGVAADGVSTNATLSRDGRYAVFSSTATNLAGNDTNGTNDVYLKDLTSGAVTLISQTAAGVVGNNQSIRGSISADGRFAVFYSQASNFSTADAGSNQDVYLKDLQTGSMTLISKNAAGQVGDGTSTAVNISADGQHIYFQSTSTNLVSGDNNAVTDVFAVSNPIYSTFLTSRMQWSSVDTAESAKVAQSTLDLYLTELSTVQSQIGSSLSRLEVASQTTANAAFAAKQAASRIMDADIAQESANLIKNQILQQASAAILAQANQNPQIALQLLTGLRNK